MAEKVTKLCNHDACKHKGTYTLDVRCSNCGWEGGEGTRGHEFSGYSNPCPRCECDRLLRCDRSATKTKRHVGFEK